MNLLSRRVAALEARKPAWPPWPPITADDVRRIWNAKAAVIAFHSGGWTPGQCAFDALAAGIDRENLMAERSMPNRARTYRDRFEHAFPMTTQRALGYCGGPSPAKMLADALSLIGPAAGQLRAELWQAFSRLTIDESVINDPAGCRLTQWERSELRAAADAPSVDAHHSGMN